MGMEWNSSCVNTAFKQFSMSGKDSDCKYKSSLIKVKLQKQSVLGVSAVRGLSPGLSCVL